MEMAKDSIIFAECYRWFLPGAVDNFVSGHVYPEDGGEGGVGGREPVGFFGSARVGMGDVEGKRAVGVGAGDIRGGPQTASAVSPKFYRFALRPKFICGSGPERPCCDENDCHINLR